MSIFSNARSQMWSSSACNNWYFAYRHDYWTSNKRWIRSVRYSLGKREVNRQIQARWVQLENSMQLDKITGKVRLTKNVKLKPNQSLKLKARSLNPLNNNQVNVIIEPTDDEECSYTIPAYTYLKSNSKGVHVGLRNMSCRTVTLCKGTVIAEFTH